MIEGQTPEGLSVEEGTTDLSWTEVLVGAHADVQKAQQELYGAAQRHKGVQIAGIPVGGIVEVS
jgi:hypothetical protein